MKNLQKLSQRGSSHLVLILLVVVVVAIAAVGYRITQTDQPVATNTVQPARNTDEPASIKSSADLKQAEASLDSTTIDSSVNPNQLDEDIATLRY